MSLKILEAGDYSDDDFEEDPSPVSSSSVSSESSVSSDEPRAIRSDSLESSSSSSMEGKKPSRQKRFKPRRLKATDRDESDSSPVPISPCSTVFSSEIDSECPAEAGHGAAENSELPHYDETSHDLQNFGSDDESLNFHDEFTAREDKPIQAGVLSRDKSLQHIVLSETKSTECAVSTCDTSTQYSVVSENKLTQWAAAEKEEVSNQTCDLKTDVGCNTLASSWKSESGNKPPSSSKRCKVSKNKI